VSIRGSGFFDWRTGGMDFHDKTVEVHYLKRALAETRNNKTQAAEISGLPSRRTLTNRLKKYGLE
jgi:DNA-binding NtrC family response regulator